MVLDLASMNKRDRRRALIGLILTFIGGLLYFTFPGLLNSALKSQLQVKEGNDFTKAWNKNPFPISLDVFVFNLENPEEFSSGAKAKLREMGPYSYNMWLYKEIISFNEDQTRVRFWESQSFEFRDDSPNKLTDKVTILNFPIYAMANMVRSMVDNLPLSFALSPVANGLVSLLFMGHSESLIKEQTVGELLNGYPFTLLDTIDFVTRPLALFGIKLPDTGMPDNKFGLLWTKNYTKGGPFEAYSGQKGTQLLQLISFKDQTALNIYPEPRCNAINGTEGSTLEVDTSKSKTYYVFTTDTCRTFDLGYEKDTWVNGIPTYRFVPNPKLFAGPSKNPINRCFCQTPEREEMCDGIFDLGRCLNGAPAAYSFPHFLGASSALRNNVENMHPDPEKHQAFIDVEPFMGSPIKGAEKLQMNALIKPISYMPGFRNFPESVLPLMWMRKGAVINDEFTFKLRMAIWPLYLILFLIYAAFFGGVLLLAMTGYGIFRKRGQILELNNVASVESKRSESTEPLQVDFNKEVPASNRTPVPSSRDNNSVGAMPVRQEPVTVVRNPRPSAPINQPLQWSSANYSAVSRRPGPHNHPANNPFISSYPKDRPLNVPPPLTQTAPYSTEVGQIPQSESQGPSRAQSRPASQAPGCVPGRAPSQRMTALATEQTHYPRLTYSSTTYQGPRGGPMSALSTRNGPVLKAQVLAPENKVPGRKVEVSRRASQQDQLRKMSLYSLTSINGDNQETNLQPLPEDEQYNDEIDFSRQFELPRNSTYDFDNYESTWTSVNEIIQENDPVKDLRACAKDEIVEIIPPEKRDRVAQSQKEESQGKEGTKKKAMPSERKATWSPPGSID